LIVKESIPSGDASEPFDFFGFLSEDPRLAGLLEEYRQVEEGVVLGGKVTLYEKSD
jgi:hypothetical protein